MTLNLKGKHFGKLTAETPIPRQRMTESRKWKCRCECGRFRTVTTSRLTKDVVYACKVCTPRDSISGSKHNLTGKTFLPSNLTAIRPTSARYNGTSIIWEFTCPLGHPTFLPGTLVATGKIKQCPECRMKCLCVSEGQCNGRHN